MTVFHDTYRVAKEEFGLFRRFPKTIISAFGISLVPALYLLIYISSVWDPTAFTNQLKVGIVNQDQGFTINNESVNVGASLVESLKKDGTFGYFDASDPAAVQEQVRSGQIAFALVIPSDFSAKAVPGVEAGAAKIQTIISEGNNYSSATLGRRFAAEMQHKVNETLNKSRWDLVLKTVDKAQDSLKRLNDGVGQLRDGAAKLNDGAKTYVDAAAQVADGFKQVGDAIRMMDDKMPEKTDLNALVSGTDALAKGQAKLGQGLKQLKAGAAKLTDGAELMQEKSKDIPFAGAKVSEGAGQLAAGGDQLTTGLSSAVKGNQKLAAGAEQINQGTEKLVNGVTQLGTGIHTLAEKIPENEKLDQFANGGASLADGTAQLLAGIDKMVEQLPKSVPKPDGTPEGLADSVHTELQVLNPVANNGTALVPNMASVALWLGALMIAYLFKMQVQTEDNRSANVLAKGLGKVIVPALLVSFQALLAFVMLRQGLKIAADNQLALWASLTFSSLVFFAVIYAFLRVLGEAGKLVAVLFLTLQLSAGGGITPIELTNSFFKAVNPWLPFTWVVKTMRTALFGALGNNITAEWVTLLSFGGIALIIAIFVGRWRYVDKVDFRPGVEL